MILTSLNVDVQSLLALVNCSLRLRGRHAAVSPAVGVRRGGRPGRRWLWTVGCGASVWGVGCGERAQLERQRRKEVEDKPSAEPFLEDAEGLADEEEGVVRRVCDAELEEEVEDEGDVEDEPEDYVEHRALDLEGKVERDDCCRDLCEASRAPW